MGYTGHEMEYASLFKGGISDGLIPGTNITVATETFHSHSGYKMQADERFPDVFTSFFRSHNLGYSNNNFRYQILLPENYSGGAIILLHGLNERSWNKYLQWGIRLASDSGRPVVFFPIAYHMNRSPHSWFDRHAMMPAVAARVSEKPAPRLSTFVNVALSTRMSLSPQRFFLSGYQTVNDLAALIDTIASGKHSLISNGGGIDIFAYSIGAMITQALMLSPGNLLPGNSRLMLFCGGSALNKMNGTSKYIMDSIAFDRLISFYINDLEEKKRKPFDWFTKLIYGTPVGEAYFAMSSLPRLKRQYGEPFRGSAGKLKAVSFTSDQVIPSSAVSDTLRGADVEVWSPQYPCSHENPFPVLTNGYAAMVDSTFERLFNTAAAFFSRQPSLIG